MLRCRPGEPVDGGGWGGYDGDAYRATPLNWENELQQNLKRRIDRLSPDLSEKSRVEAVDAIILEEAKKLQQKYRTVYSASASFVTPLFSPGLHKTLKPLYTEYPTEETESNPIIRAAGEGLKNGFSLGLWTEAFEGIYPQRTQSGVRGDAEILGDVAGDAGKTAGKLVTEGAGNDLKMSDKQFGKKVGKHAEDFGLDPSSSESRDFVKGKANEIYKNATEIRQGEWMGLGGKLPNGMRMPGQAKFYIQGKDVVVTDMDGNFITIMKDGVNNLRVQAAKKIWSK